MKHVFKVKLESCVATCEGGYVPRVLRPMYEIIADNATQAIAKAMAQAKKDYIYRGNFICVRLKHRGAAV